MEYFTSDNINKVVGAPIEKEYNMWSDDIWKDAPRVSPTQTGWVDAPTISPVKPNWCTPDSTPPKPSEYQWSTPERSEDSPMDYNDLDTSPRTSTPVPDESMENIDADSKDQYDCFKIHLCESPKKLKVRGAVCEGNETIIAGHIDMKHLDPFSYTFEQHYMPKLNACFVNLLINGPAPLLCHEHYDENNPNHFVANCHCLPVCNCRVNLAMNRNLPIGYKYNEDGFVIPTVPSMPPRVHHRDPNCIYTV